MLLDNCGGSPCDELPSLRNAERSRYGANILCRTRGRLRIGLWGRPARRSFGGAQRKEGAVTRRRTKWERGKPCPRCGKPMYRTLCAEVCFCGIPRPRKNTPKPVRARRRLDKRAPASPASDTPQVPRSQLAACAVLQCFRGPHSCHGLDGYGIGYDIRPNSIAAAPIRPTTPKGAGGGRVSRGRARGGLVFPSGNFGQSAL